MADLFKTEPTKQTQQAQPTPKPSSIVPQEIAFDSAKKSKVKIKYTSHAFGGIKGSPVLTQSLKAFVDDFEKEGPIVVKPEVKE